MAEAAGPAPPPSLWHPPRLAPTAARYEGAYAHIRHAPLAPPANPPARPSTADTDCSMYSRKGSPTFELRSASCVAQLAVLVHSDKCMRIASRKRKFSQNWVLVLKL